MGKLTDSITIARAPQVVRTFLDDLERHPIVDPDGFKNYRFLSRQTQGPGATAAVLVNLLGFWLPSELSIAESTSSYVTLRVRANVAIIDLKFILEGTPRSTYVWLDVDYTRRHLPPWRVRTRVKQLLRLENDLELLCSRFLRSLKYRLELSAPDTPTPPDTAPSPLERFPVDPRQEFWEV